MPILWSFFGILQAISLGIMGIALYRLYAYIQRYRFDESHYTLLFGFVRLRWFAYIYVFMTMFWIVISFMILRI